MAHVEIKLIRTLILYLANLLSSPNNSNNESVDYLAFQHKKSYYLRIMFYFFSPSFIDLCFLFIFVEAWTRTSSTMSNRRIQSFFLVPLLCRPSEF